MIDDSLIVLLVFDIVVIGCVLVLATVTQIIHDKYKNHKNKIKSKEK